MQHWQLPFLGLHTFPTDLTEFEIRYFFTFGFPVVIGKFLALRNYALQYQYL